jgi:3-oxoacyl-(acyl-carrier-protein) synthase
VVANVAVTRDIETVMNNSFGFGGHNATLIFGRADR